MLIQIHTQTKGIGYTQTKSETKTPKANRIGIRTMGMECTFIQNGNPLAPKYRYCIYNTNILLIKYTN